MNRLDYTKRVKREKKLPLEVKAVPTKNLNKNNLKKE